jgi:hypothetical protein
MTGSSRSGDFAGRVETKDGTVYLSISGPNLAFQQDILGSRPGAFASSRAIILWGISHKSVKPQRIDTETHATLRA